MNDEDKLDNIKTKYKQIRKEDKKRRWALFIMLGFDFLAVLIVVLAPNEELIYLIISITIIWINCVAFLIYNRIVGKRIKKIIRGIPI